MVSLKIPVFVEDRLMFTGWALVDPVVRAEILRDERIKAAQGN